MMAALPGHPVDWYRFNSEMNVREYFNCSQQTMYMNILIAHDKQYKKCMAETATHYIPIPNPLSGPS